jgi:hypothetical protein
MVDRAREDALPDLRGVGIRRELRRLDSVLPVREAGARMNGDDKLL